MIFKLGCTYNNYRGFAPFLYTKQKKAFYLFISLSSYPIIFFLSPQIPQTQLNFYTYSLHLFYPYPPTVTTPPPPSLFFSFSYRALLSLPHFSFFLLSFPSIPLGQAPAPCPISFYFSSFSFNASMLSLEVFHSTSHLHCCDFFILCL